MSPNAQVVHGIPNDTPLENGDIISSAHFIDCGAFMKTGFMGIMLQGNHTPLR